MSSISQIDKNFMVESRLGIDGIKFFNALDSHFSLYGVFYENGAYRRMPETVAQTVSEGVYVLHTHTAGGRIKFATTSSYVAIKAIMSDICKMPHFALTGSAGFDLYIGENEVYYNTFVPPFDITDGYESVIRFPNNDRREITINFPLYSSVAELYIGIEDGALLEKDCGYKNQSPVVFYGSSITQGGCASRAGNSYQSIISRALRLDYVNLGFSGNARGELAMAEYISGLDMAAFVYDYDYNAPNAAHLTGTHEKMFKKIREKHPKLPIIILSRPKIELTDEEEARLRVIKSTFSNAIAKGDENVYLIEGRELMAFAGDNGTVDGCHPNDLGFYSMAQPLIEKLKSIL